MSSEREAIDRHFSPIPKRGGGVVVGVGDDAAVLSFGAEAVVSTDTLAEGTHFRVGTDARLLGRKSLSANLSDIAAMGARPRHALLALTLPSLDDGWLGEFSAGFMSVADEHGVSLVGGDICRGPVTMVNVTVTGEPVGPILRIDGARPGDDVWVSGTVGGAGDELRGDAAPASGSALHDPTPRVGLGQALSGIATAATDLSDGLCAGVCVMSGKSGSRMVIEGKRVPVSGAAQGEMDAGRLVRAVCSGEDYELLFTAAKGDRERVHALSREAGVGVTRVGEVVGGEGAVMTFAGEEHDLAGLKDMVFDHFAASGDKGGSTEDLVGKVAARALEVGARVFTAESCTGGTLAGALTSVAGSSDWYEGGAVSYTVGLKGRMLDVDPATVERFGVVSEQVAAEMARGCLAYEGVTHAVSVTGWAGPAGGDGQDPGTVCVGCADGGASWAGTHVFGGDRAAVRKQAVDAALRALLGALNGKTGGR